MHTYRIDNSSKISEKFVCCTENFRVGLDCSMRCEDFIESTKKINFTKDSDVLEMNRAVGSDWSRKKVNC